MAAAITIPRRSALGAVATLDLRAPRVLGAAMLGAAAIRPELPMEVVPPCPLRLMTGIPCPMCGMTRGVAAFVHGDLASAFVLNPASVLAGVLALLLLVQIRTKRVVLPVWTIVTVLAVMWTWQLFKYATGRPL